MTKPKTFLVERPAVYDITLDRWVPEPECDAIRWTGLTVLIGGRWILRVASLWHWGLGPVPGGCRIDGHDFRVFRLGCLTWLWLS